MNGIFPILFSIIFLWVTMEAIVEYKKINSFLPFFVLGILYSLSAAFIFYGLFSASYWMVVSLSYPSILFWIITKLREINK